MPWLVGASILRRMCGFAGVVSFTAENRIGDAAALAAAWSADLAHRGPDGEGFFGDESAVLVHRRLAILDPRPRSDQPFVSDDGKLVLVFNGEIYNFRDLRRDLPPRDWRTDGDTEVLLAAYAAWGERCVERLHGMFAFAVLDRRDPSDPRVFLARDRAGQKPLYVALSHAPAPVEGDAPLLRETRILVAPASVLAPNPRLKPVGFDSKVESSPETGASGASGADPRVSPLSRERSERNERSQTVASPDPFLASESGRASSSEQGSKPTGSPVGYDATGAGAIAFASELAPLRRLPWVDLGLDDRALRDYLAWGYVPDPLTICRGVAKLMPGCTQTTTRAGTTTRRYFDAAARHEPSQESDGDARFAAPVTRTRDAVTAAVARRLVSDVPVGCLLSGGIDSSVVALCMARLMLDQGRRPATFSIGFDDPRYDESHHARAVAAFLGTDHHEFRVTPRVAEILPKLARVFGEPFADSSAIPTHYLAQETRSYVKVALGGDGGDELFGGYDRYRALAVTQKLDALPATMRRAIAAVSSKLGRGHPKSLRARVVRLGESLGDSPAGRYGGYVRLFSRALIDRLLPTSSALASLAAKPEFGGATLDDFLDERGVMAAAAALDRATYLPGDLLVKLDRCSMLHALEVRSPFMDADLLRFASTLTDGQLRDARGGKKLLRDAFAADLPPEVFSRRKMGFAVPVGDWFRGELRPMLRDTLLAADSFARAHLNLAVVEDLLDQHDRCTDHGHRLYALLMLELWWRDSSGRAATRPS